MFSSKKIIVLLIALSLLFSSSAFAQKTILLKENLVWEIIAEVSGELQVNNIMQMAPYEMNRPEREYLENYRETDFMLNILKQYGFSDVHVEKFDSPPQWDAVRGRLTVTGLRKEIIADHDRVAASLARGSITSNVKTELVYVPNGSSKKSYKNFNVKGKIVISEGSISSIFNAAVNSHGAAGAVSYEVRYPERYPDMLVWSTVKPDKKTQRGFGFQITYPKGKELIARLKKGKKISVHADVETKDYPRKLDVVTALIPGTDRSAQELLFIAHLYEGVSKQGANDNYSGVVCTLETGRTILKLIKEGLIKQPRRSIRFLWVAHFSGSRAYIKKHPDEMERVFAGINMDMVGEHLFKTRSYFNVCRSAWAMPSFFNDVVQDFAELTREMNNNALTPYYGKFALQIASPSGSQLPFLLNIIGYDSGSDHMVFSNGNVKIPIVFFNCWPDDFYHSNMDTPDKSDPTQLKRVAFIAAASAIVATSAKPEDAITFAALSAGKGRRRIANKYEYSIKLMQTAKAADLYTAYKKAAITIEQSYKYEIVNLKTLLKIAEDDKNAISSIENQAANFNTEMNASLKSLNEMYTFLCRQHGVKSVQLVLTPEEEKMSKLIPIKKEKGMVAQMAVKMNSGLPKSHDVNKHSYAAWELANFIDGKKTMLEIAHAVIAEFGGPMPEKSAEFFYGLEKNGVIELKKK
ncbi:MAG: M28 family peptidase [Deltaproteobacteria bacterium]|nr:M28 family peptidase [Deltaproteobacteria bacterium]